jgi:hypothetical protein
MGAMQAFLMQFLFCQVFCDQFRNAIHSNENTHKDNEQNACVKPVDFKPAVDGRGEYFVEKFQRRSLMIEQIKIIWGPVQCCPEQGIADHCNDCHDTHKT